MLSQEKVPSFSQVLETSFSFVHQVDGLNLCQSQKLSSLLSVINYLVLLVSSSFYLTQLIQVFMVSWTWR